jgi:MerR family transcriptional regulator, thiopeptide resistance regulator
MTSKFLKIGEVVARTGLTERAIRHYEDTGLIAPDRALSGQRLFSAPDIERLAAIQILRRANFSIAEIGVFLSAKIETAALIQAQIESLEATVSSAEASITLLRGLARDIETGGQADLDLLCQIVSVGEQCVPDAKAREVFDRYFARERQQPWLDMQTRLRARVDPESYDAAWASLAGDIKAALDADPRSPVAQDLLARWNTLLEPFRAVADATQQAEASAFWSRVGEWGEAFDQPVNQAVVDFIIAASAAKAHQKDR